MSKRPLLFSSALAVTLGLPTAALAQQQPPPPPPPPAAAPSHCPPGSWFCADSGQQSAAPAGQAVPLQQIPREAPPPAPGTTYVYGPGAPPPPVVVYQPPPPVVVYQAPRYAPPPPVYYVPRRQTYPKRNEWGLNLHVEGAAFGHASTATHDSGMGGVGFGLRYKPIPAFGIEADLDFTAGRDYNGFKRDETAFTMNGLVFFNPKSRAQVYMLAGFGWSGAHVINDSIGYDQWARDYTYFGGQGGLGVEFRVAKHFALNLEALGFVRERIDSGANSQPEFYDPTTGQSSNTSGGALFRGGMTFYF